MHDFIKSSVTLNWNRKPLYKNTEFHGFRVQEEYTESVFPLLVLKQLILPDILNERLYDLALFINGHNLIFPIYIYLFFHQIGIVFLCH